MVFPLYTKLIKVPIIYIRKQLLIKKQKLQIESKEMDTLITIICILKKKSFFLTTESNKIIFFIKLISEKK